MNDVRWGARNPAGPDEARARLLDAAVSCFEEKGIRKTTIGDVARAARVTRPTVYKYFKNRDELVMALLVREAPHFVARVATHLGERPLGLEERLVEVVAFCIETLPGDRWYGLLFAEDALPITRGLVLGSPELLDMAGALLARLFEPARASGRLRDELELRDFLEWTIRLVFSYAVTPSPREPSAEALRKLVRSLLVPALVRDA